MSSRIRHLALAAGALVIAAAAGPASPARAAVDPARDPVVLEGDARVARLKQDILWQTARLERREAAERARALRRRGHRGASMRPEVPDEDRRAGRTSRGGSRPAAAVAVAGLPANVLVNDKSADGPFACQSEAGIALLGTLGLAAWNDGQGIDTGGDTQAAGVTTNGGATWSERALPHPPGAAVAYWKSDPAVAVNAKTGSFYFVGLTSGLGSGSNGVAVVRGSFPGGVFAWDTVRVLRTAPATTLLFDKPWIAVDSLSGRLAVTYTTFGNSDSILLQTSTDGRTWTAPRLVNTAGFGRVQGSRPAFGANGELVVVWQEMGSWSADFLRARKSTDGGSTFGTVSTVASVYGNFGTGAPGFNRPQGLTMPSIAVDRSVGPNRGRVYVGWNEAVNYYDDPLGGSGAKVEVEPNSSFSRATPFTPGQKLRGALTSQLDLDYWSFSATQGTTYIFYCDSVSKVLTYYMRIFCGADTSTRLAFSGDPISRGKTGLIVWTAPSSGTYYLRMAPNDTTGGYRIQTGVDAPSAGERARDARDVFVSSSADGVIWGTPVRVNDDAPGLDDWLPELAVTAEGYPYATWLDWRDALANCAGQSNVYVSRSTSAGGSWAPNRRVTSATTVWSYTAANVAPNQGDYLALTGAGGTLGFAWADGRLGDVDVWSAALPVRGTVTPPPDSAWAPGTRHVARFTLGNPDVVFDNSWVATLSSARAWPGLPVTSGSLPVPAGGTAATSFSVTVPDSAAPGTNRLELVLRQSDGVALDSATVTITIPNAAAVAAAAPPALLLRGVWPNPTSRGLHVVFSLPLAAPAHLELLDLAGRRVLLRDVGGLGAGNHLVDLSAEAGHLPPGVYALRLTQGRSSVTAKIAVVR